MINYIFNRLGYVKKDKHEEKVQEKIVAVVTGEQTFTTIKEDGSEHYSNKYNISFTCIENSNGERNYIYSGVKVPTGRIYEWNYREHARFVNIVAPWLNGANCIPDEFLVDKRKSLKCNHCDNEFPISQNDLKIDFVKCSVCSKTSLNPYNFDEKYQKQYQLEQVDSFLTSLRKGIAKDVNPKTKRPYFNQKELSKVEKYVSMIHSEIKNKLKEMGAEE